MNRKTLPNTRCSDGESPESYTSSEIDSSGDEKQFSPSFSTVIVVDSDADSVTMEDSSQLTADDVDDTFVDVVSPFSPGEVQMSEDLSPSEELKLDAFMSEEDAEAAAHYQEMLEANPDNYHLLDDDENVGGAFLNPIDNSILTSFDSSALFDFSSRNYVDVRLPSPELTLEDEEAGEEFRECLDSLDDEGGSAPSLLLNSVGSMPPLHHMDAFKSSPAYKPDKRGIAREDVKLTTGSRTGNTTQASSQQMVATPVFLAQGPPGATGQLGSIITTHMARIVPTGDGSSFVLHVGLNTANGNSTSSSSNGRKLTHPDNTQALPSHRLMLGNANTQSIKTKSNANIGTTPKVTRQAPSAGGKGNVMVSVLSKNDALLRVSPALIKPGLLTHPAASKFNKPALSPPGADDSFRSKGYRRRNSKELRELAELEEITTNCLSGELDRFVICSDGDMRCALCGFHTASYSSFKSHIICSHPCWRITKKLSRNRLLVEKSVRVSVPVSSFSVPNPIPAVPIQQRVQSKRSRKRPTSIEAAASAKPSNRLSLDEHRGSVGSAKVAQVKCVPIFRCTKCCCDFRHETEVLEHLLSKHQVRRRPYHFVQVSLDQGRNFQNMHRCTHPNCSFSGSSRFELNIHLTSAHDNLLTEWS